MTRKGDVVSELNLRFGYLALSHCFSCCWAIPLSLTRPRSGTYSRVPLALGVFALATFGVSGMSSWSARSPRTATAVIWTLMGIALIAQPPLDVAAEHARQQLALARERPRAHLRGGVLSLAGHRA